MSEAKSKILPLAGIVTLYNPTDEDIANISTYIDEIDHLYVIDNTEGHDNLERLPKNKKIEYIWNNNNIGVAAALNLGAKKALSAGYRWLLTNDQDTTFPKGVVNEMKKRILTEKHNWRLAIVTPYHKTKMRDRRPKYDDDPHDVMTSGNIINLGIWKEVGGFEEDFFIDGIDIEYCIKIHDHGYHILRFHDLEIKHNLGYDPVYRKFLGKTYLITNYSPVRYYYIMRNYHYIFQKYYEIDFAFCFSIANSQKHNMIGTLLFEKDKFKKIRMYLRGHRDYKRGVKGKYPYAK